MRTGLKLAGALLCLLLLMSATVSGATGSAVAATTTSPLTSTSNSQDATSLVYVSGVDYDPQVFFPYETGTVTVHLTNTGSGSVGLSHPDLLGSSVHLLNSEAYDQLSYIGPGATLTYTFQIKADPPEGYSYPLFTIGTKDSQSVHFPIQIQVESTPVRTSISNKPDSFSIEKTDLVNVSITNPRDGAINNVLIVPQGAGFDATPSEAFLPTVAAGSSVVVPFSITPHKQGDVTFHVTYRNGKNPHSSDVVLPFNIGADKTAASPVINNIALSTTGNSYQITGDVSNAGITDAKSMVLTVASPARPVEPYASYAVGSLASDDFSSFQLTFSSSDLSSVPVVVQWKDAEGNPFSTTSNLDLRSLSSAGASTRTGSAGSTAGSGATGVAGGGVQRGGGPQTVSIFGGRGGGGLSSFYPLIIGGIVVVIAVVLFVKRKWIIARIRKQ